MTSPFKPLLTMTTLLALAGCQVLSSLEDEATSGALDTEPVVESTPQVTVESVREGDAQAGIGAREHPSIVKANGGVYENTAMEELLALVTGELIAQGGEGNEARAYQITLLDSPTVNAFALPGGYLYVTRGLLALANDAAEIAAVLAHEMAHVQANHGIERSRQVASGELVQEVLSEVLTNDVAGAVAGSAARQRQAAFSQNQELQADALGIRRLGAAGFDPFGAPRFLKSLARFTAWLDGASSAFDDGATELGGSHPSTPRRVALAERHARALGPRGKGQRDRERYLKAINGMAFGDKASEGYVRANTYAHKRLGVAFDVPAGFSLTNRSDGVLAAGPDDQALRFDSAAIEGAADPAAYIDSGWIAGLDASTVANTTIDGLPAATGVATAGDWRFDVAAIALKGRYYRFILATPRGVEPTGAAATIANSFRRLSARDAATFKPQTITLATVVEGDTAERLAEKLVGVQRPVELFRALNGLDAGEQPEAGSTVKLISG